jgi:Ca2+-binding RTX toxin-like protein
VRGKGEALPPEPGATVIVMRRSAGSGGAGLRALSASAICAAVLIGLVGVAYASFYSGTDGDDLIVIKRNGSVAYLEGGNDTFKGAKGIKASRKDQRYGGGDHVRGGPGSDRIFGRVYTDVLRGGEGDDLVLGGAQRDEMHGGPGADTLKGGPGTDLFRPGRGRDVCVGQRKDYGFPGFSPGCDVVRIRD